MIAVDCIRSNLMMIADINLQQLQLTLVIGNQLAVIAFKMRNTAGNQVTSQLIAFFTQNDRMTSECTHPCCFQSCNTAADNEYGFLCTGCSNAVNFLTSARRITAQQIGPLAILPDSPHDSPRHGRISSVLPF